MARYSQANYNCKWALISLVKSNLYYQLFGIDVSTNKRILHAVTQRMWADCISYLFVSIPSPWRFGPSETHLRFFMVFISARSITIRDSGNRWLLLFLQRSIKKLKRSLDSHLRPNASHHRCHKFPSRHHKKSFLCHRRAHKPLYAYAFFIRIAHLQLDSINPYFYD